MTRTIHHTFALIAAVLLTTAILAPAVEVPSGGSPFTVELA